VNSSNFSYVKISLRTVVAWPRKTIVPLFIKYDTIGIEVGIDRIYAVGELNGLFDVVAIFRNVCRSVYSF